MEARHYGLKTVLSIQDEINEAAQAQGRPAIDLINHEEHSRILELMELNTWPDGWTGEEIRADRLVAKVYASGVVQPLMLEEV